MKLDIQPARLSLAKNQIVQLPNGRDYRVVCHQGSLWITQHGDAKDFILNAGESMLLDRSGPALVYALDPAACLIERASAGKLEAVKTALQRAAAGTPSVAERLASV